MKCDICGKKILNVHRKVFVHKGTKEDSKQGSYSNCEKEISCCNDCIINLNFREVKK